MGEVGPLRRRLSAGSVIVAEDELIDGYKVVGGIASSSGSSVLEVVEPGSARHLAMKLLNTKHPDYKDNIKTLKHEASVLKTLEHPNIVKYEGFTAGRDNTYMLMEYFRAPNVKLQIKSDIYNLHMRFKKFIEGLLLALQHLHEKGWVHRDIKPENVLMNKVGEVRLVDFSIASKPRSAIAKLLGGKQVSIQGTRIYIAPETILKYPPTAQTDMYSLGAMLFEVLTGRIPFAAPTPNELLQKHLTAEPPKPSEVNRIVTPELDAFVFRLMSKKPEKRGKDMGELLAEVRRMEFFKEEPKPPTDENAPIKSSDLLTQLDEVKLDSRMDAQRREMIEANPEIAQQFEDQKRQKQEKREAEKARRIAALKKTEKGGGAATAPLAPMAMPPGYPPGYGMPGMMPMPGMPQPGYYPMPQQMPMQPMMPQYPMGPMAPPMPMAGTQPPMPVPPPMPMQPPMPQRPAAPAAPAPARPAPPAAARQAAPPAPTKPPAAPVPARPAPPTPSPNTEDLDYMTELPDVL